MTMAWANILLLIAYLAVLGWMAFCVAGILRYAKRIFLLLERQASVEPSGCEQKR